MYYYCTYRKNIYLCIYVCIYIDVFIVQYSYSLCCIYVYIYICIYILQTNTQPSTQTHTHTHTHTYTHTDIFITHTHTHTCTTYIHITQRAHNGKIVLIQPASSINHIISNNCQTELARRPGDWVLIDFLTCSQPHVIWFPSDTMFIKGILHKGINRYCLQDLYEQ